MQKDIIEKKVTPGQYFVLMFDLSKINARLDLKAAEETLIKILNSSVELFYETYAAYLGKSYADLCQTIDGKEPNMSLLNCARHVRNAIKQLKGIEGIYVLVDEYDAFPNNYLELPKTAADKITWADTDVGRTFKSFWSTIKALGKEGPVRRIFATGISPLSLSILSSAFNVTRNVSFKLDIAGLCGLTYSDLEGALKEICQDSEACNSFLSEMTKFFNGYHFCMDRVVETVCSTETCLAYFQRILEGNTPRAEDPENCEVSEQFLRRCAASAPVIRDFEYALKRDDKGNFFPLVYGRFKSKFTLGDLVS